MTQHLDLFKKWMTLQPGRCRVSDEMIDVRLGPRWISVFSLRLSLVLGETGWAVTQAAVQEALHYRQLRFRITDVSNHIQNKSVFEVDVMRDDFEYLVEREYTCPAFGLLDAYITALERMEPEEGDRPFLPLQTAEPEIATAEIEQSQ